jgi:hypothetical protein
MKERLEVVNFQNVALPGQGEADRSINEQGRIFREEASKDVFSMKN